MSARHEPVLLAETLAFLRTGPGCYLDATVGDGGHAEALLDAEPGARLLACDRDPDAIRFAAERLARFGSRVMLAHATFRDLPDVHRVHGGEPLAGALLDLGLSSRQIDTAERGMSFMAESPLDLRMDPTTGTPARERLAQVTEDDLAAALRAHGDVGPARRIARAIVREARAGRLATTVALARTVDRAWEGRPHPRRRARVFQALRIWINEETQDLEAVLNWLPDAVRPGGVVVTLAYHSGEDRIIKRSLRPEKQPARRLPFLEDRLPSGPWEELTRKVVVPSQTEIAANPRARSARLRAFRRRSS
jgi:16S rRNA (cytosine1402-N4)-methyltransferase